MYSESIYKISKLLEWGVLIYWESYSSIMGYGDTRVNKSRVHTVKNGFSDPTKEQKGRDWARKDVVNWHQVKALREGCHERKKAWAGVSSREKMNTNMNLAVKNGFSDLTKEQ